MTKVSICIPTYHAKGAGPKVLKRLLKSISEQSFTDYEVVVSDHSKPEEEEIYLLCVEHSSELNLTYLDYHENYGNSASNTNNAINHATGELIKVMNHDDFFYHPDALKLMVEAIDDKGWLACGCIHTDAQETKLERPHKPLWPGEKNMVEAINRIGCPTVTLFMASEELRFDESPEVNYAMDCEFYIKLFREYGPPVILDDTGVVIRMWENQLSNQVNIPAEIEKGKRYMRKKYGYK